MAIPCTKGLGWHFAWDYGGFQLKDSFYRAVPRFVLPHRQVLGQLYTCETLQSYVAYIYNVGLGWKGEATLEVLIPCALTVL